MLPYMKEFKPDLILMSAGFDAHKVRSLRVVAGLAFNLNPGVTIAPPDLCPLQRDGTESRAARTTLPKTDVVDSLNWRHNASLAPGSPTPSLHSVHSLGITQLKPRLHFQGPY